MIQFELPQNSNTNIIKVVGVGGGGGNAVNYMYNLGMEGVDFIVCNTDKKALNNSPVPTKIQLGPSLTQGLGAGANPEIGQRACQESIEEIENLLVNNTKMVFVTAGMGGGTGTGGAPIMAKVAKDLGILTVGIVTTPFSYEGKRRMRQAEEGIDALRGCVDTILVISNDKLRQQFGNIAASQAFCRADDILATATKCITDVINSQGHIVVDFADVSTVMRDGGVAILGNATARGENRAYEAAEQALNSPLLNDSNINGAKWVLLNINSAHGIHEHTLDEVEMIQAYIQEQAGEECDVIFGTGFDDNLHDHISVTIIATGFEYKKTQNAFTAEKMTPHADKTKIVMKLGQTGEENKLFDSPNNNTPATEEPKAAVKEVFELKEEEEIIEAVDPMAPTMMEIEPPAIPSFMAIGLGMGARKWKMPAPEVVELKMETLVEEIQTKEIEMVNEVKDMYVLEETETNVVSEPIHEVEMIKEEAKIVFELSPEVEERASSINAQAAIEETAAQDALNVQAELDALFNTPATETTTTPMAVVEKTEQQMKDEFVTMKGITINRKKGSRYLTDSELEAEVNFELQKRAFDERASKLRSMSFNVNKADIDNDESNIPAYQRQNKILDAHPSSNEDVYSDINISNGSTNQSGISTLNTFLNSKRPD